MEFKTKQDQRVVCDSISAFLEIRERYFPETTIQQWRIAGDPLGTVTLHSLMHTLKKGN